MIHITNTKRFNQSFDNFTRGINNKYQTFGEEKKPIPQEILNRISKSRFMDEPLTKDEIIQLKEHLESKINELVSTRVPEPDPRTKIIFLGEEIGLNGTPWGKNLQDNSIKWFFYAYNICEECLEENKPVYLSIVPDN